MGPGRMGAEPPSAGRCQEAAQRAQRHGSARTRGEEPWSGCRRKDPGMPEGQKQRGAGEQPLGRFLSGQPHRGVTAGRLRAEPALCPATGHSPCLAACLPACHGADLAPTKHPSPRSGMEAAVPGAWSPPAHMCSPRGAQPLAPARCPPPQHPRSLQPFGQCSVPGRGPSLHPPPPLR